MQVALGVTAHQLAVLGESHIAFDHARTLARTGFIRFLGVLGELQRGAAMSDGEIGLVERTGLAALQLVLEAAVVQTVDQIEGAVADLHRAARWRALIVMTVAVLIVAAIVVTGARCEGT